MAEGGGGLGLGSEAAQESFVAGQSGVEHLDRHPPAQGDVVGQVDLGRRSAADGCVEPVAPAEHAAELLRQS